MATKTEQFGRNYSAPAVEVAEYLTLLLHGIRNIRKRDAKSLVRLLVDAHRCAYEGADIDEPLGHSWCLSDLDIVQPLLRKVAEEYGIEVPELEGMQW